MDAKKLKCGSVDAISSLPDEVLGKILSVLPTKEAASTSLLSKRWRNLFPLMLQLSESQHHDDSDLRYPPVEKEYEVIRESFKSFVDKSLSGCKSIKKLSLKFRSYRLSLDLIDQWIQKAFERGLVDLDLYLDTNTVRNLTKSVACFVTSKSLVRLTLRMDYCNALLAAIPSPAKVSLPMLKSLSLHAFWSSIAYLCGNMLPSCPILEELSLHCSGVYHHCYTEGNYVDLQLIPKTLKRFTLRHDKTIDFSRVTFTTPSLVYLDYSGLAPLHPYTTNANHGFLDSLVEAKLDVVDVTNDGSIAPLSTAVSWMRNVKNLSLTSASVETMSSHLKKKEPLPLFVNLVRLSFESNTEQGWEILPRILNQSPKLETLVLKGLHCVRKEGVCIDQKEVKVLEIHAFKGKSREFGQLKSFLCQMQFLQEIRVKIKADDYKKLQLISRLLDLPEPSSKCQINFM